MLTKGLSINENKYETLVEKLRRLLFEKNIKKVEISAIGGPCLAAGLANRVQSGVVIAGNNLNTVKLLKEMLSTNYYRISTTTDVNGVEVCAAIKNIFSMAIGAAAGLNKIKANNNIFLREEKKSKSPILFIKEIKYIFLYTKIAIRPKFTLIVILVYNNIYLICFSKSMGDFEIVFF